MKKLFVITAVMAGFCAPAAFADGDNENKPTERELAERRCGNNGEGNDAEVLIYRRGEWICRKNVNFRGEPDEDHRRDVDPN
ncbi:hypothetical protein [Leisingera sp. ANG-Vp]|uniref:hypothetical protein n=1 Tax=Leisingera sp. ANG-Vp TaxID=1577896 RepID=UPI000A8969EE|nr:hypothetical protein [Leisingera sp. ANG-Vp]